MQSGVVQSARIARCVSAVCLAAAVLFSGCVASPVRAEPLEDVYESVRSSVVTIMTASRALSAESQGGILLAESSGVGSGVLISDDGLIVTAAHVVHTADAMVVTFVDGTTIRAHVISSDTRSDLALIKLDDPTPAGAKPATIADSDEVRIGSNIFIVGAPLGLGHTLTVGYISARRSAPSQFDSIIPLEVFQTDAAVNSGNSGGPMFNMDGEVIGIISYIVSKSGGSDGLGFAITSNSVKSVLIDRPPFWGGVKGVELSREMALALNVPDGAGFLVQRVARGSTGALLGLRGGSISVMVAGEEVLLGGDIIISVEGVGMGTPDYSDRMRLAIESLTKDDRMDVTVLRGGQVVELSGKSHLAVIEE